MVSALSFPLRTVMTVATDRRIAPRHQPAFGTVCRLGRRMGLVRNISQTGLSMLLGDPLEPGAELDGTLSLDGESLGLRVKVQVIHIREVATGDYLMGVRFGKPLKADEIRPFISSESDDSAIPPKG
jgi:hypothetical protein